MSTKDLINLENFLDTHFNGKTWLENNDRIPVDVWNKLTENNCFELGYELDVSPNDGFRYFVERNILKDKVRVFLYFLRELEINLNNKYLVTESKHTKERWVKCFDTAIECYLEYKKKISENSKLYNYYTVNNKEQYETHND